MWPHISYNNSENKSKLAHAGAIEALVVLLESRTPSCREAAAGALRNLLASHDNKDRRRAVRRSRGSLHRLYLGIADGMFTARVWACRYSK